jgi:hypothetical protein
VGSTSQQETYSPLRLNLSIQSGSMPSPIGYMGSPAGSQAALTLGSTSPAVAGYLSRQRDTTSSADALPVSDSATASRQNFSPGITLSSEELRRFAIFHTTIEIYRDQYSSMAPSEFKDSEPSCCDSSWRDDGCDFYAVDSVEPDHLPGVHPVVVKNFAGSKHHGCQQQAKPLPIANELSVAIPEEVLASIAAPSVVRITTSEDASEAALVEGDKQADSESNNEMEEGGRLVEEETESAVLRLLSVSEMPETPSFSGSVDPVNASLNLSDPLAFLDESKFLDPPKPDVEQLNPNEVTEVLAEVGRFLQEANIKKIKSLAAVKPFYSNNDCTLILPLGKYRGTFLFSDTRIAFYGSCIPLKQQASEESRTVPLTQNWNWSIGSLTQVLPRRFMLQDIAIELFFRDGRSYFLVFHDSETEDIVTAFQVSVREERDKAFKKLCQLTKQPVQPVAAAERFESSQLEARWRRWEISNFEYIMELNILAGRSYADISQYPIFPWVIALITLLIALITLTLLTLVSLRIQYFPV